VCVCDVTLTTADGGVVGQLRRYSLSFLRRGDVNILLPPAQSDLASSLSHPHTIMLGMIKV